MIRQFTFLFLGLVLTVSPSFSQQVLSSENKKALKAYEDAKRYYDSRQDQEAIKELNKAIKEDPQFFDAYVLLAYIYQDANQLDKSVESVKKALSLKPNAFPPLYLTLGKLEIERGKYSEAADALKTFMSQSRNNEQLGKAEKLLKDALFASEAIKNPVPFNPQNLGPGVNSEFNEYYPAITADNQTFLFTRDIKDEQARGGSQEDFYVSYFRDGKWSEAKNVGQPVNTPMNEGAPTIAPDGQTIILTACEIFGEYGPGRNGMGSCDLFYSRKSGQAWSRPMNLGGPVNTAVWESQPSLASDGKTLYFVRATGKGANKSADIWVASVDDQGYWTPPERLSDTVNTPGNEESVFIHPDNQTLYFSSNGHPGMGGQDLYVCRRQPNGRWGKPVNLGYPINTSGDENSLVVSADGKTAYFASSREGGRGGLDLYSFELPPPARATLVTYMKGKIFDAETKKPLEAVFQLVDLETGALAVESFSNPVTGEFLVSLPTNKDYALNATKNGYLFFSENFSLKGVTDNAKPVEKDVPLQPIRVGEKVVLKNVFFPTASAELRSQSKIELNRLIAFLAKNPAVKIQLNGHTDNVGDDKANQVLSENRARAVYNYLVSNKVDPTRLSSKGFGESMPIASNDTEEGRQMNRRTEFEIIAK